MITPPHELRKAVALVSDMNEPLGPAIGTGLEALEARDFLRGARRSDRRLRALCERLAGANRTDMTATTRESIPEVTPIIEADRQPAAKSNVFSATPQPYSRTSEFAAAVRTECGVFFA